MPASGAPLSNRSHREKEVKDHPKTRTPQTTWASPEVKPRLAFPSWLARVFQAGTHCHCLCPPPSASTVSGSLIFSQPAEFAKDLSQLMSHGLQVLEHGNISGGQPGFGGPCPEGRGDTDQSSVQEGSCQTRGMKWSGPHGNLKDGQGLEEVRAGRNLGTDLGLHSHNPNLARLSGNMR